MVKSYIWSLLTFSWKSIQKCIVFCRQRSLNNKYCVNNIRVCLAIYVIGCSFGWLLWSINEIRGHYVTFCFRYFTLCWIFFQLSMSHCIFHYCQHSIWRPINIFITVHCNQTAFCVALELVCFSSSEVLFSNKTF